MLCVLLHLKNFIISKPNAEKACL